MQSLRGGKRGKSNQYLMRWDNRGRFHSCKMKGVDQIRERDRELGVERERGRQTDRQREPHSAPERTVQHNVKGSTGANGHKTIRTIHQVKAMESQR